MKALIVSVLLSISIDNMQGQNVGIGTSSPQFRLHVEGNIQSNHLFVDELRQKEVDQGIILLGKTNAADQEFWFGEDNAIYVNQAGDVGFGTLTPTAKLDINGNASGKRFLTNDRIRTDLFGGVNLFTFYPEYNTLWVANGTMSARPGENITLQETTNSTWHSVKNKLKIEGDLTVGSLGSGISLIKKITISEDLPMILDDDHLFREYTVPGAMPGDIVILSLNSRLPTLMGLTGARVSAPNTVRVKYYNENTVGFNANPMQLYIAVLSFK